MVEEYVTEFYALVARNQLRESQEQLMSQFTEGLNRLIRSRLVFSTYAMVDTIQAAIKIEKSLSKPTQPPPTRYINYKSPNPFYNQYYQPSPSLEPHYSLTLYPEDSSYSPSHQKQRSFTHSPNNQYHSPQTNPPLFPTPQSQNLKPPPHHNTNRPPPPFTTNNRPRTINYQQFNQPPPKLPGPYDKTQRR